MKDMIENEIKAGDILLEVAMEGSGWKYLKDGSTVPTHSITLWELSLRDGKPDGHGYQYTQEGKKHLCAWYRLDMSIKMNFNLFDTELKELFYHGVHRLETTILDKNADLKTLIDNSDWKDYKIVADKVYCV